MSATELPAVSLEVSAGSTAGDQTVPHCSESSVASDPLKTAWRVGPLPSDTAAKATFLCARMDLIQPVR